MLATLTLATALAVPSPSYATASRWFMPSLASGTPAN